VSEKYEFIDAECATLPAEGDAPAVVQMCEWLGVSTSGFYDWRSRPQSEAAQRRELLKIKVKALFEANNEEYGYRRIHAALVRGGETVDDETVRTIMRDLGLVPCQPKPWRRSLTEQDGQAQCHLVWRGHALGVPAWRIVPLVTLGERMAVARMALRVGGRFTAGMLGS